jgi:hypothetical protein
MTLTLRVRALVGGLLALAGLGFLVFGRSRETPAYAAQPEPATEVTPLPAGEIASRPNVVRQGFPAGKADPNDLTKSDTAWEIEWELTHPNNRPFYPPGSVLRIKSAKFMWKDRTGKPRWVTVARMLELAEIYVPYDNGYIAFLDIHDMPFHITPARQEYLGPACVAPGEILKSPNPAWSGTVHKEVHDDGIRWMSAETNYRNQIADRARRGEKMILWSTYYGANYRYLIEYGFGDDGMLSCRIGPTGRTIFDRREDHGDTHLHIGCWRFEPDLGDPTATSLAPAVRPAPAAAASVGRRGPVPPLSPGGRGVGSEGVPSGPGGPADNEILLVRRLLDENTERFTQVAKPFNKNFRGQACEGSARWTPEEFTTLRIESKVRKNAHGRPIAFDLVPQRVGALRQLQPEGGSYAANMDWINQDFWVTRADPGNTSYLDVPRYAAERRSLEGFPTTVWHCAPVLHFPRGEDFDVNDGKNSFGGLAITFWTGFYLKPRDLFDGTPLYQPTASGGR